MVNLINSIPKTYSTSGSLLALDVLGLRRSGPNASFQSAGIASQHIIQTKTNNYWYQSSCHKVKLAQQRRFNNEWQQWHGRPLLGKTKRCRCEQATLSCSTWQLTFRPFSLRVFYEFASGIHESYGLKDVNVRSEALESIFLLKSRDQNSVCLTRFNSSYLRLFRILTSSLNFIELDGITAALCYLQCKIIGNNCNYSQYYKLLDGDDQVIVQYIVQV